MGINYNRCPHCKAVIVFEKDTWPDKDEEVRCGVCCKKFTFKGMEKKEIEVKLKVVIDTSKDLRTGNCDICKLNSWNGCSSFLLHALGLRPCPGVITAIEKKEIYNRDLNND